MNKITHYQLMSKPTGSRCNIHCDYCYYLEKDKLDDSHSLVMNDETLENYVRQYIESQDVNIVDFIWQGGEPTLAGIEFYKKAIELQKKHACGKKINNYFQTNGILIDDEWAAFFKENEFLLGLSIDGDDEFNDKYRRTNSGKGILNKILSAVEILNKYKVEFNTLTVVNDKNIKNPLRVYSFLKSIGSKYMQFIPLVEREVTVRRKGELYLVEPEYAEACNVTDWSLQPAEFGRFLNKIFDEWFKKDIGKVFVMNFEETMTKKYSGQSSCIISEYCGANLIVEKNGDIYSCDHFVFPEYKIGNINQDQLINIINTESQISFGQRKKTNQSAECKTCDYLNLCHGGCQKHRFLKSQNGLMNKNYFCESYKIYHKHCLPRMEYLLSKL